jgi:hypothetical protein
MSFLERSPAGVRLHVRVTPRARREAIEGLETDAAGRARLKVRVSVPPAEGAANARVIALLAKAIGRPASAFTLAGGAHHRNKILEIAGDAEDLMVRLKRLSVEAR